MIYLILLVANFLFICFTKSNKKYWLLSIPLWAFLITSFLLWRANSDRYVRNLEIEYWQSAKGKEYGDHGKWIKFGEAKKEMQRKNNLLVHLIGLQTFITFILQIVGQRQTKQNTYWWTKLIFGILFVLIFLILAMMGIVPSGGMLG